MASGQGVAYSVFGGNKLKQSDINGINNYAKAMKNGSTSAQAWQSSMGGCSVAAKQYVLSAKKAGKSTEEMLDGLKEVPKTANSASVGLKALSVAGNMLMMMSISMAISAIIKGLQALANAQEEAIKKADEFISKFEEQRSALTSNKNNIDSMSADYEKLARGVDSLGRNVSLNSDEYTRYNEIVNQIADMFPQMVQGYTDEGNAIIAHKGSVEELTKAYEDQKKAAQDAIIVGSADVFKGYKAQVNHSAENFIWEESGLSQMKEFAEKLIAAKNDESAIQDILEDYQDTYVARDLLKKSGLDLGFLHWNVTNSGYFKENMAAIESAFNIINTEINKQAAKIKPIMQAYLEQSEKFQLADDKIQDMVKQVVGQFDAEFYNQFNNETQMASWVETNVLDVLKNNQNLVNDFGIVFNLQTQFNNNEIPLAEYEDKLSGFLSAISILPEETQRAIKLVFGIGEDGYDSNQSNKNKILDMLKGDWEEAKKYVGSLTLGELEVGASLNFKTDSVSIDDFAKALKKAGKNASELTVSLSELEKVSDDIKPLGTAFKELSDDGYITIKTLKEMKDAADLSNEEWTEYESKLLRAKAGSSEFNRVMSDLTYKILDNTFASADLNNLTEQQVAAILRENGVVNASAVAHEWLKNAKIKNKLATFDFNSATQDELDTLYKELKVLGLTETAVGKLSKAYAEAQAAMLKAATTGALNRLKISQDELEGIKSISDAYKLMAGKGYDVNGDRIADYYGSEKNRGSFDKHRDQYNADVESVLGIVKAQEEIEKILDSITTNSTVPDYSNAAKDKSKSDKNEALDNYLKDAENRYKIHQDETKYIEELQYAYDNLTKTDKERLDITGKINEAYRDLADNRIKDIEHQIDLAKELNEYADVSDYYKQIQKVSHEEANRLRAMGYDDNSNEIQDLQKKWWDAQNSIADESYSKSERWISERNTYNDWDLYGDNEIAAWERVLKRFKTEFPNELEKIKDIEQKIFEARKAAMEKSIDDIEDYIDARNTYNDWDAYGDSEVKAIQRQTKIIEDMYNQRLLSYEEYIDKLEEQSQRIYSLGQDRVDKHLSDIDKYIDARNFYNDWDDFGDTEIGAVEKQLKVLKKAYRLNLISYEEYTEKFAEYTQKLYSVAKNNIIEEVSKLIEDYEEMKQLESSQLESQKTLLQSYYDVTNSIAEAQHEINKELKASMSMYEYLNEETRELLFNQEDYEALNKELLDIQAAADALQKQYQEDILNANAETIAEITSQYQMQYETMMKQYEIAKAELEVAKKRQQLDNVLAERNTRMFINGQWQWVANTQDVINAQNELAEAETERKKKEASLEQTEAINDFTEKINSLETDLNKVREYWSDMQEMLNGEADDVAKALKEISEVSSPELKKVIDATGGSITSFSTTLSESTTTLSDIVSGDRGLGTVSTNIDTIITDLENYSDAIQNLINKINGVSTDSNKKGNSSSVDAIIAQMQANSIKWHVASEIEKEALHKENLQLGASIGATYDSTTGQWTYPEVKSSPSSGSTSSSKGSSSGTISTTTVTNPDGSKTKVTIDASTGSTTTKGLSTGTVVHTAGGDYKIVSSGTVGATYNPNSGYWSVKVNADGSRYTSGGLNLIGEEGFEAFISNTGRLIPISQPTLANIGAGGIIFNREQMANLRNLWDISNLGKVSPFISSSNANNQSTLIDNSIHINGMTIGERGNEDWINGLRRYVATHK